MCGFRKKGVFQIISNGLSYSFLWELVLAEVNTNSAKAEFKLQYKLSEPDTYKTYQYYFDVSDFKVGFYGFAKK